MEPTRAPATGGGQPLRIVLASNNAKKLSELQAMLARLPAQLVPQGSLGIGEAAEPFETFIENGLAKARHAAAAAGGPALADDSGVCVAALGGAPGVHSATYGGVVSGGASSDGTTDREARRRLQDAANNALLLQRLQGVEQRHAYFVCTLVAVRHAQDPEPLVAVGRWHGEILQAPRGTQGFGYDPLMFIPALDHTVAELSAQEKNQHSHRARALAQMRTLLQDVWRL